MRAAAKAGLTTLTDVAKALGVGKAFLSRVLSGDKKLPPTRAAKFHQLTGYRWE
jgi:hypothetical protein